MDKISIVIPTRNRIVKLSKCIDSIPKLDYINIVVGCDGDKETYDFILEHFKHVEPILFDRHKGSVYVRNKIIPTCEDGVLYCVDDVIFYKNSIEKLFDTFNKKFKDDDGVVGINLDGVKGTGHPTGIALVGKNFIKRYPNGVLFNPDYYLFACQEVLWLAEKLDKFYFEKESVAFHSHPSFYQEMKDQTHIDGRVRSKEDHQLMKTRQSKGEIWGL